MLGNAANGAPDVAFSSVSPSPPSGEHLNFGRSRAVCRVPARAGGRARSALRSWSRMPSPAGMTARPAGSPRPPAREPPGVSPSRRPACVARPCPIHRVGGGGGGSPRRRSRYPANRAGQWAKARRRRHERAGGHAERRPSLQKRRPWGRLAPPVKDFSASGGVTRRATIPRFLPCPRRPSCDLAQVGAPSSCNGSDRVSLLAPPRRQRCRRCLRVPPPDHPGSSACRSGKVRCRTHGATGAHTYDRAHGDLDCGPRRAQSVWTNGWGNVRPRFCLGRIGPVVPTAIHHRARPQGVVEGVRVRCTQCSLARRARAWRSGRCIAARFLMCPNTIRRFGGGVIVIIACARVEAKPRGAVCKRRAHASCVGLTGRSLGEQ